MGGNVGNAVVSSYLCVNVPDFFGQRGVSTPPPCHARLSSIFPVLSARGRPTAAAAAAVVAQAKTGARLTELSVCDVALRNLVRPTELNELAEVSGCSCFLTRAD